MDYKEKIEPLSTPEYRKFGLMFGLIIAFLFGLFFPLVFGASFKLWPWVAGSIFALWALVAPASIRFAYFPWMRFALVLGFVNTRVILGLTFFILFLPISIVLRIFGIDPLMRKVYDRKIDTYWIDSTKPESDGMEKLY
ncbi:MAG: SxtJ family membrane protein [Gammaproteobacteria bacterium]|nr:sxtJ [Pseudomonadales bacterium]